MVCAAFLASSLSFFKASLAFPALVEVFYN
jgi:hypothetical protein